MPVLRKSPYVTIEHRVASRLVYLVRTAEPFEDPLSARREIGAWARSVSGLTASELGLLMDWRLATMIVDTEILREVVSRTDAIGRQFARQALLMQSALGVLQSQRLSRVHESAPVVFSEEAAAWAYATSR